MSASPIQVVLVGRMFSIVRPGSHYAIRRSGDEHTGAWLPKGEALPVGSVDTFTENEARAVLPMLRAIEGRAAGKGGRTSRAPTTPDGKLIARACRRLGLTAVALAEAIGAHEGVLSRARSGELPEKHRVAIKTLLAARKATE